MSSSDPVERVLGDSWETIERSWSELTAAADEAVSRRALAPRDADWEFFEPFWSARHGRPPRLRELVGEPADWGAVVEYGYDSAGRIVLARRFRGLAGGAQTSEERVLLHGPRGLVQLYFFHDPEGRTELRAVVAPEYRDGRLESVTKWVDPRRTPGDCSSETYVYEADQLSAIKQERKTYRLSYDDSGELLTITVRTSDAGDDAIVYRRSSPKSVNAARRLVEKRLPAQISQWVKRVAPPEPVYCLAIAYDAADSAGFPPNLAIGRYRELAEWRATLQPSALETVIWNPAEFELFDSNATELMADEDLVHAYQELEQEWRAVRDEAALRGLMIKCAKQVAAMDLGLDAGVLSQVAVYTVDVELSDLDRNLRATVPTDQRRRIERGIIGADLPNR